MNDPRIETLTAAFFDDPMTEFLFPRRESRAKRLPVGIEFFLGFASQTLDIGTEKGECCAVIGAASPDSRSHSLLNSLFSIFMLIFRALSLGMPLSLIYRWLRIFSTLEKMHPSVPHWYVLILGVHPSHQGKGLGGRLLKQIFEKADSDGVPVYLESSNPKNLDFYRKNGFEVLKEIVPIPGCPPVWTLLRKQENPSSCSR